MPPPPYLSRMMGAPIVDTASCTVEKASCVCAATGFASRNLSRFRQCFKMVFCRTSRSTPSSSMVYCVDATILEREENESFGGRGAIVC